MDCKKIGEYIKRKRKEVGLTQEEVGDLMGVSGKAVSKWETGVALPDVSLFLDLSKLLKIDVYELLVGEDNKKIPIDKKKNILIIILSIFLVLVSIVSLFLGIFYVKNYDNVKVYDLVSVKNTFHIEGKLIQIGNTSYVCISEITPLLKDKEEYYLYDIEYRLYYEDNLVYSNGDLESFYLDNDSYKKAFSSIFESVFVIKELEDFVYDEDGFFVLQIELLNEDLGVDYLGVRIAFN